MKRSIKSLGIMAMLRREARSVFKLSPWVLGSLLLAALLWHSDLAAKGGLFQSVPATPTPVPTLTPTATTELPSSPTATIQPPLSPTATTQPPLSPTATTELPSPTATPTATPPGALTATLVPTNVPSPTATPTETPVLPTETPVPPAVTSTPSQTEPDDGQRYAQEDSNLLFEWAVLVDSVALGLSYAWLCCGVLLFLSIPVFFITLWVASKRRQQGEE